MTEESTSPNGLRPGVSVGALATLSSQLSPEQLSSAFTTLCYAKECTDEPPRKSSTSAMLWGSLVGAQQLKNNEKNLKRGEELPLISHGTAMLKEHMYQAADVIAEVRSGSVSTRLVASIGGASMVVSGIMSFIGDVFSLNFFNAIIQCYMVLFGVMVVIIEMGLHGKNWKWGALISKNARFLCFVNGRGAFYFFIGTLALTEWNLLRFVLGVYMMAVGVGLVWFGYLANKKLEAINGAAQNVSQLREMFDKYDKNQSNSLTTEELSQLCTVCPLHCAEIVMYFVELGTILISPPLFYFYFSKGFRCWTISV
eukprot:145010_1